MTSELVQTEDTDEPPGTKPGAQPSFPVFDPATSPSDRPRLQPVPSSRPAVPRLTINPQTDAFRRRFYPQATRARVERLALADRATASARSRTSSAMLRLSDDERAAIERTAAALPVGITPYYASLLDRARPDAAAAAHRGPGHGRVHARRRGEADDPLGEDGDMPGAGPRASLSRTACCFLVTDFCSTYCRYCTRSRVVGTTGEYQPQQRTQLEQALDYIARDARRSATC